MGHKFAEIAFTPTVRKAQERNGSRRSYARLEEGEAHHDSLGSRETAFIADRDSFYMATVSETGWPYIQHRGGPAGFVRILDDKTIGFADFAGNRQYVSDVSSACPCGSVRIRGMPVLLQPYLHSLGWACGPTDARPSCTRISPRPVIVLRPPALSRC